jgi:hypothetical protein
MKRDPVQEPETQELLASPQRPTHAQPASAALSSFKQDPSENEEFQAALAPSTQALPASELSPTGALVEGKPDDEKHGNVGAPTKHIKLEHDDFVQGSSRDQNGSLNRHQKLLMTPRRAARLSGDYSAFKGRGRYAAEKRYFIQSYLPQKPTALRQCFSATNTPVTINAQFVIDVAHNEGRGFAFSDVVRNRSKRSRLAGSDCECCRDVSKLIPLITSWR